MRRFVLLLATVLLVGGPPSRAQERDAEGAGDALPVDSEPGPELAVTAVFTLKRERADGPPLPGAVVQLWHQGKAGEPGRKVAEGTTDAAGVLELALEFDRRTASTGSWMARAIAADGMVQKWKLEDFPATRRWSFHLPPADEPAAPTPLFFPFEAAEAERLQADWASHLGVKIEVENSLGMKLRLIPPGKFLMGSPTDEADRDDDETQVSVELTEAFRLGAYEVTQREYATLMGVNPSWCASTGDGSAQVSGLDTSRFPVEVASWWDAASFCNALSRKEGRKEYYLIAGKRAEIVGGTGYRLPTEAEWEWACRAGTSTPFSFGSGLNGTEANCNGNDSYGTSVAGPNLGRTTTVGSYRSNAWGLYDLHGNVWEWCEDGYEENLPGGANPLASPSHDSASRVFRGGGWRGRAADCRSAFRGGDAPGRRSGNIGFRVACSCGE